MVKESHLAGRGNTGVGLTREETASAVTRGAYYTRSWATYGFDYLSGVKIWRNELGPTVVELSRIHHLSAQRFIEHASEGFEDPNFDAGQYASTTLSIYREFGRKVGEGFTRSYVETINSGLSPEEYYELMKKAATEGGKIFASMIGDNVQSVIRNGGNAVEFVDAALRVRELLDMRNKKGRRMLWAFTGSGGGMARSKSQEVFFQDYSDLAVKAFKELGEDAAYYLLKCLPQLVAINHINLFDFYLDMVDLKDEHGQNAVKQYLAGIAKNKDRLKETGDEAQEKLDAAKKAYSDLKSSCKQTAATFFSFRGLRLEDTDVLLENQRAITWLKANVPARVFSAAAWYGSRIKSIPLKDMIVQIKDYADQKGIKETIRELQYAAGVGPYRNLASFPALHPVEEIYVGESRNPKTIWGPIDGDERFWDNEGREQIDMEKLQRYWDRLDNHGQNDTWEEDGDSKSESILHDAPLNPHIDFPEVHLLEGRQYRLPDF